MLILVYRCEVVGGTLAIQDPAEIAELAWFDPADYPEPTTLSGPPAGARGRHAGEGRSARARLSAFCAMCLVAA